MCSHTSYMDRPCGLELQLRGAARRRAMAGDINGDGPLRAPAGKRRGRAEAVEGIEILQAGRA